MTTAITNPTISKTGTKYCGEITLSVALSSPESIRYIQSMLDSDGLTGSLKLTTVDGLSHSTEVLDIHQTDWQSFDDI